MKMQTKYDSVTNRWIVGYYNCGVFVVVASYPVTVAA